MIEVEWVRDCQCYDYIMRVRPISCTSWRYWLCLLALVLLRRVSHRRLRRAEFRLWEFRPFRCWAPNSKSSFWRASASSAGCNTRRPRRWSSPWRCGRRWRPRFWRPRPRKRRFAPSRSWFGWRSWRWRRWIRPRTDKSWRWPKGRLIRFVFSSGRLSRAGKRWTRFRRPRSLPKNAYYINWIEGKYHRYLFLSYVRRTSRRWNRVYRFWDLRPAKRRPNWRWNSADCIIWRWPPTPERRRTRPRWLRCRSTAGPSRCRKVLSRGDAF